MAERKFRNRRSLVVALAVISPIAAAIAAIGPTSMANAALVGTPVSMAAANSAQTATTCANYAHTIGSGIVLETGCHTARQRITAGIGDTKPALSPDGTQLAFVGLGGGSFDIYTVPVSGGAPFQVTHLGSARSPTWSPDGTQLAFSANATDGSLHLFKVRPNGSSLTQFTAGPFDANPTWCANGKMAFRSSGSSLPDNIYVVNADGSGRTRLTFSDYNDNPTWSPDCRYILYDGYDTVDPRNPAGASVPMDIYAVPATGGTPVQLTATGAAEQPNVSNDWTLAYRFRETSGEFRREIYLQWLGGTTAERVPALSSSDLNEWPSFTPGDGTIPAPAGFPIAVGSPAPNPTPTLTPKPTPTPTPTGSCPIAGLNGELIGVRGSGEKESDFGGLGRTVQTVANTFASRVPLIDVAHVDYPAIPVGYQGVDYGWQYDKSVDTGRILLKTKIKQFLRQCPGKYVVLVGFSQGSHVVGDVLAELTLAQRKWIAAVILIGDPRFNHKQKHGVNVGTFGPFNGIYGIKQKPRDITGKSTDSVREVCIGGDPVCNNYLPSIASCVSNILTGLCPHLQYVESGWADRAGLWAARRFISLN